jgi:palmitoyltransferase ZDHHC9/14/18
MQTTYENFRYRYDGKTNPYNKGCMKNLIETLFSKAPKSKLNLREKIHDDSIIFASSHSLETSTVDSSADVAKTSFDLEIAAPADKRTGVLLEEFDDIHAQIENLGKLERCGTQPRHIDTSWEARAKNGWEMKDDIEALALEFGMEYGYTDRGRNSRDFL